VLAPLRVAKTTWPDEVVKWKHTEHLRVVPIVGNVKQRLTALAKPAEVYTTNYEQLPWLVEHYGDRWPFKTVVADEQTRLKSYRTRQGSKRARALAQVAFTKVTRFIGLTGTPSPNGLLDLWGQTWFVDRGERLGKSFSAFEARWFYKGWDGFSVKPHDHAQKEIEGRLRDVCLTVTGLPVDEPITNEIYVDLPSDARATYDEMEREMFMEIEEFGVEALNAAAQTMKLLQLANGAAYIDDKQDWREVHDEKIEALRSVVEEAAGAPVLVAYHFKSDLARLRAAFPKARVLDADPATIREWNEGRIPLLFAHPASAGHGLNLARGGNILAFFSLNWSLENYMQIIERIGPMRQKQEGLDRPVFVHHILARNTVDDMILERLKSKRTVQEILLEAMKRRKK
jgi:SNF2 family DNA or RNA helicase